MEKERNLYYFVSDVHLGLDHRGMWEREKKFSSFLRSLPENTKALFLLGDIFDFWYEYKDVIPRKFARTLGALAQLTDRGVEVYFFNGNHDVWTYGYFQEELGIKVLHQPYVTELAGKRFCLGHGDGLGEGDSGYKFLKGVFENKFLQFLFSGIHPRWAFALAHKWSKHNRLAHGEPEHQLHGFRGEDERIVQFANRFQRDSLSPMDYFIFGHYHYGINAPLQAGGEIYILGEWIYQCDYLVFDGDSLQRRVY